MPFHRLAVLCFLFAFLTPSTLRARVISYAPVTDRFASPAIQKRTNRYYALVESRHPEFVIPRISAPVPPPDRKGQLVLYDSRGEHEPRVILPRSGEGEVLLPIVAVSETADGTSRLLVNTSAGVDGNASPTMRHMYSPDGGRNWIELAVPETNVISAFFRDDTGGEVVRGRGAQVRIGNDATPFVFAATEYPSWQPGNTSIYSVDADGTLRRLLEMEANSGAAIIGGNRDGSKVFVTGSPRAGSGATTGRGLRLINVASAAVTDVAVPLTAGYFSQAWMTPSGDVYFESNEPDSLQTLSVFRDGVRANIAEMLPSATANFEPTLFAVPTADYSGAWIVRRSIGSPTTLLRHTPGESPVVQWSDVSGPQVEAVHAARSNQRLLIQVHRPRTLQEQSLFIDPALAIWEVGGAAPSRYDELFLNEGFAKTFVSLNVDEVARGGWFVFDSAATSFVPPPPISSGGGGGDVAQEWGIVKGSLQQRLLIPSIARLSGMHASEWRSDLIVQNDQASTLKVDYRFAPTTFGGEETSGSFTLRPREIRLYRDAVKSLLGYDAGGGALFLTPEFGSSVTATSRIYSENAAGSFGMGAGAVDLATGGGPRFAFSFAGAIQGANSRTNVLVTDTSGRGSEVRFSTTGLAGETSKSVYASSNRQVQINGLSSLLELNQLESAGVTAAAASGEAIVSLLSIDNLTNDPTYFTPDLSSSVARTIPIVGHVSGVNGAQFRSDLYLYNPTPQPRSVLLAAKMWETTEPELFVSLTLLGGETKVIRDALLVLFGKTGIARLRYVSGGPGETVGVRVTSRTYSVDAAGGTYGFVMPPLNSFQSAANGEALEILGAIADAKFRTNLALVELSPNSTSTPARVRISISDEDGRVIDSFETAVATAGGVQLFDLFTSRGVQGTSRPLLIRVETISGAVAAFATMLDNGTNDPTYLAASLAAQN